MLPNENITPVPHTTGMDWKPGRLIGIAMGVAAAELLNQGSEQGE